MLFFRTKPVLAKLPRIALSVDSLRVLLSAAEFRLEFLKQIHEAKHRIYICSLYLQNDEGGAEILAALHAAKKARPNLDVAVFVDAHRAQRGLIGEIKSPGVIAGNAAWYQKVSFEHNSEVPIYGVPVQTRELFGVLHLKGFVFDDQVLYSGASINNLYLHQHDKYRYDRYVVINNAILAESMVQFMRSHLLSDHVAVQRLDVPGFSVVRNIRREVRAFRQRLKHVNYQFNNLLKSSVANVQGMTVTPLVGVGKNNSLNRIICQLLADSVKEVVICTPYFNFPLAITREINRAIARGVKVDIVVGDKTASDFYIPPEEKFKIISALPYLYEMKLRRFVKKHQASISNGKLNVHLWKDGDHSYHLKGVWIDQIYTLLTGNNLNPRAFSLDLENGLLIHDPAGDFVAQRGVELASIMRNTSKLSHYSQLQKLSHYPAEVTKLLGRLSRSRLDYLAYRVL